MSLHVVQYSGGIGSWAAAQRVVAEHGRHNVVLLIADTRAEDSDLWRFVDETCADLGITPTVVSDGRTPFEVFRDHRFLGNSRIAPCSYYLKQRPCRRWLEANADVTDTVVHVGIDASEQRRIPAIETAWAPWRVHFPLCDPPLLSKEQMLQAACDQGIAPPRLYRLGFAHNNCAGMCVRAGHKQWLHLLRTFPERFAAAQEQEAQLRETLGDVAILRDRAGGSSRPLPLAELRARASTHPTRERTF